MTETTWQAAKRRAELIGAFLAVTVVEAVKGTFYWDETEPLRRRWWRRKANRE